MLAFVFNSATGDIQPFNYGNDTEILKKISAKSPAVPVIVYYFSETELTALNYTFK